MAAKAERSEVLGVVMPLANEETTVADLLRRVLLQLRAQDLVFCVLDNASVDGTRRVVERIAATDPRVRPVWAPENRCVVDAYFRGYREAMANRCDWILEMDGGFSHCPEEISRFASAMRQGVDFAAGSRFIKGGSHRGSWTRTWLSRGGSLLTNFLLGTQMKDMTSGFECFSSRAMQHVLTRGVRSRRHFFQTEIRCLLQGWQWVEVPITYTNPSKSVGGASITEALRNLTNLYLESRSHDKRNRQSDRRGNDNSATDAKHQAAPRETAA